METYNTISQKKINKELQEVAEILKTIPDISFNYMEYISALIYAIYENDAIIQKISNNISENIRLIVYAIDNELIQIRKREDSQQLFINISFSEIINRENENIFIRAISKLTELFKKLSDLKDNKQKLAEAFEYIISKAVENNYFVSKNGEFYTPNSIVKTMIGLLDIKDKTSIYNPCSGSGNFIVESAKSADIYAFGEETDISNYNICITNLWLHNIKNTKMREYHTNGIPSTDIVLVNPPFKNRNKVNETYSNYGSIFMKASIYTKFLINILEKTNMNTKIGIILPHGFLFKKNEAESVVRERLVESCFIDTIIGLPEKLFYDSKIPVVLVILDKTKKSSDVLFIDASKEYKSKRKINVLTEENQNKILNTYKNRIFEQNYSYIANIEEIRKNDYDLNIKKYVHFKNENKKINQEETIQQIHNLERKKQEIQKKITELLPF